MLRPKHDGALNWRRDIPLQPQKSFIKGRVIEAWGKGKEKKKLRSGEARGTSSEWISRANPPEQSPQTKGVSRFYKFS